MNIDTRYRRIRPDFSLAKNALRMESSHSEPRAVLGHIPVFWNQALDFSVWDKEGNRWIDLTSGIFVTNAGHSNPYIKDALKRQIDSDMMFAYNYPTEVREKFLLKLLGISPSYFDQIILLNSGSEAVDVAYKLIKLWAKKHGKRYIVTFTGSYHGRGLSNDLICGDKSRAGWSGVSDGDVCFLKFPYEETDRFDPGMLPEHTQIAAFFLETFQGWGAWFYPNRFINDLYAFSRSVGALVCFDEMQSGFYRLGPLYGYMTYGDSIKPDILCVGKGISSSLPLSAVISRKEIADIDHYADLHGTHSGNPLCCAAALANLEFLSDPMRLKEFHETMKVFEKEIGDLGTMKLVRRVNVRGMIAGLIFENADIATAVAMKCIENGVLPVCTFKKSIKIAPPLTITVEALREAVSVIRDAISILGG